MDTPSSNSQRGAIRVSDAERDQAVAELSEHYQAGRLTLEEFDDRSSRALSARTGNDLSALFGDLPKGAAAPFRAPAGIADPVPAVGTDVRRAGGPPIARIIIPFVIAAIIFGNIADGAHGHHAIGWLIPVLILGMVFLRLIRRR
jgi:hypothetical protein